MKLKCHRCGQTFSTPAGNAKWCPDCKPEVVRARRRRHYHKGSGKTTQAEYYKRMRAGAEVAEEQGWQALAYAIVTHAFYERDVEWLQEFGTEFLRYSGNYMSDDEFDGLLEEAYLAKEEELEKETKREPTQTDYRPDDRVRDAASRYGAELLDRAQHAKDDGGTP